MSSAVAQTNCRPFCGVAATNAYFLDQDKHTTCRPHNPPEVTSVCIFQAKTSVSEINYAGSAAAAATVLWLRATRSNRNTRLINLQNKGRFARARGRQCRERPRDRAGRVPAAQRTKHTQISGCQRYFHGPTRRSSATGKSANFATSCVCICRYARFRFLGHRVIDAVAIERTQCSSCRTLIFFVRHPSAPRDRLRNCRGSACASLMAIVRRH